MSADNFVKTSWSWQFYQFQQQVEEWLEYQFSQFSIKLPGLPHVPAEPQVIDVLNILFWLILGAILARIAWFLWREFNPYIYAWLAWLTSERKFASSHQKNSSGEFSATSLIKQARRFAQQNNYREACRYIYLATLQQLHEQQIAPQQLSRTDREYLQLLPVKTLEQQSYLVLFHTHERLCFSGKEILQDNYQQCWQAYQRLYLQQPDNA